MHFSRNPPGPNTSCIKGSVDSFAVLSAAPCRATPTPVGSSSNCTYSRSAVFAARLTLAACSGPKTGTVCTVNCGGNGTVAVTMVADTLPANPALLTFQVTIASITFTPASGTATTVNLNPALTVDLMRLQADTVFLGAFANIPAAQYNSATLTLSGSANITFLNDTPNTTISGCPPATICPLRVAAS